MQGQSHRHVQFTLGAPGPRGRRSLWRPVAWAAGVVCAAAAVTLGALLAVFTAAALAVIALFASVLMFFTGAALRARRTAHAGAGAPGVIEARKVGHQWVTYGWDRQSR